MVVSNRSEEKISISDLRYQGMPIDPSAVCARNGLHSYLYHTGVRDQVLITFSPPFRLFQARDMGDMAFSGAPLDTWIARAQAKYLSELGVPLPADALQRYRQALVTSYMLGSSLCVVQKKTDQGLVYDFVTKNPAILALYRDRMVASDRSKDFNRQLTFQFAEVTKNAFDAVRLFWERDDMVHTDRYRVGSRSAGYIFPYYAVENYVGRLLSELGNKRVRLCYLDAQGQECSLVTTYHTGTVAAWMGSALSVATVKNWADWRSSSSVGFISLPDLQQPGRFVSVPVLRITRLAVL
ncbi:MAG: hypothetical protein E6Y08_08540 [Paenibacillus sp.]|uniref:hypothetical protein n=1 Tax=Paenibacillus sp. TaxID=58172 RepID=UPI00290BD4C5|nr:hypothetical protein [Paenibacillus sp.]MDU4695850.1 hypothetical protein [Paenibacillus sp.]